METIKDISELFLLSLAFGTGLFTFLTKPSWTGEGFYKLIQSVCGGSLIISMMVYLTRHSLLTPVAIGYYLLIIFIGASFLIPVKDQSPVHIILAVFKNIIFLLLGYLQVGTNLSHYLHFLLSVIFIGSIVYGMLLGHWYLVVPKLSERPLLRSVQITWICLLPKLIFSFVGLMQMGQLLSAESSSQWGRESFGWLILTMRYIWGYLAIITLSIFAWKLVKMRSIQSATGILYTMVFFLFVGELISAYVFYQYGIYL